MDFRTTFPIPSPGFSLTCTDPVLMLGSCFTDHIGARLQQSGVPVSVNPCGVQYNPASIAALIHACLDGNLPAGATFRYDDTERCWLMPAKTTHDTSPQECLQRLHRSLEQARCLTVTLGTAWIYLHLPSVLSPFAGVVGNCHKVPAREFQRRCMDADEISALWMPLIERLRTLNPGLQIIFTVSPIRHFKDGAHENTLSKATLHLALQKIMDSTSGTYYFPAWELMMDDLRDYRFYDKDMLHPSAVAVDYIYERFEQALYCEADRRDMAVARKQQLRAGHRTIRAGSTISVEPRAANR